MEDTYSDGFENRQKIKNNLEFFSEPEPFLVCYA